MPLKLFKWVIVMNIKKVLSLVLAISILGSCFAACSKQEQTVATTTPVEEVKDADDNVTMKVSDDTQNILEVTDKQGNALTIIPVYNVDGITAFAGYIEKAVDKNGKALDEKSYPYIKTVIAMEIDAQGKGVIKYTSDNKFITLDANCDDNGYIIAIQDSVDLDGDKDTKEYFKVVTKLDNQKNMFIKLDKDENGKPINVTVEKDSNGNITVTDETGKKTSAVNSKDSANLEDVVQNNGNKNETNSNGGNSGQGNQTPDTPSDNTPQVDYTSIVLLDGGKVACDADNVRLEGSAATGGTEVIIDGAGEHSKYYVTSETGTFYGQLEFRFEVDEAVEVKVYNVNISTSKKTAVKFTNVDTESEKENDSEEVGDGNDQSGTSAITPAPDVEFSITGSNSFKASGSGTNGTIYSECKLAIKGHGSAEIDGGQNLSGICSTESIDIKNATLNITSNAKQGISCDKKVTIKGGATINIESKGDGIHCNKFESDVLDQGEVDSKITIRSLSEAQGADGIDANDHIIINSGHFDIVSLTPLKYALKVRKINKERDNCYFEINGGTVSAIGATNSRFTACKQKTVLASLRSASASPVTFTIGNVTSSAAGRSFVCSPVSADVDRVTASNSKKAVIRWDSNTNTGIASI